MNEQPIPPPTYLREIFANSFRHGGEITAAVGCVIVAVLATMALGGRGNLLVVLPPAVGAVLMLEVGVAAWRLHRRQQVALATRQSLLDLNASDLADLEGRLVARFRSRERRIGERNEARVQRLTDEIAALQSVSSS
jgi:hypothetical protein